MVVHPGTSAAARAYPIDRWRAVVAAVTAAGRPVVVTGGPGETGPAGRVAAALSARGHDARGVDADASLVEAGREQYPGLPLEHRNLLDLGADDGPFEVVVAAGNVLVYVEPGTEAAVLRALASVLAPGGSAVLGFATDRAYTVADLDRDAAAVGWRLVHRFSTWQLDPWTDDADWAVSVFR